MIPLVLLSLFGLMDAAGKTSTGILILFSGFGAMCFAALAHEHKNRRVRWWEFLAILFVVGGLAAILFPWYAMEMQREAHREWRSAHPHEHHVWE